jgi:signal transduction histidine kinase
MVPPDDDAVKWARAAAGDVAVDVAAELSAPLGALRDRLAMLVDRIDRHISVQTGPEPYPWKNLQALRQDLAHAYLETTNLARLAVDLDRTMGALGHGPVVIEDVEHIVESAVHLARHRVSANTELLLDCGILPAIRAPAAELTLAISRMVAACGVSAALVERAALSVRARAEEAAWVVITVSDNGAGAPAAAAALGPLLAFARSIGGTFTGTSERAHGSAFELRLPAVAR